jgi:hypothetical protein
LALSSYIDATILLVEENKTTPDEIERACELLRHVNLLGIVLNKSREMPDPEPSRRRQSGLFLRLFAARHKDLAIPAPPAGKKETSMPGPAPDHRNGVPQVSHAATTSSPRPTDRTVDKGQAELVPVPRIPPPRRLRLLTVRFVGFFLGILVAGAAWMVQRTGMISWPPSLSLPVLELPVK